MSMDSSFASEWDSKLWCSRSFVCIAGIRLVVLRCSIILLKLNNNKRNEITVNSPVSRHPWDQAYNVAVCLQAQVSAYKRLGTLSNENVDIADVTGVHQKSFVFLSKCFDGIGSS